MKRRLTLGLVFLFFLIGLSQPIKAGFVLRLDDGAGNSTTILDDDLDGVVTHIGSLGLWSINVTTGISKPAIPAVSMDLSSVDVSSSGPATLIISVTDTHFSLGDTQPAYYFNTSWGGTTQGTVNLYQYYDTNNQEFGQTTLVHHLGPYVGPIMGFSYNKETLVPSTAGLFSITTVIAINHLAKNKVTSFDALSNVTPVSEPGTIMLLGAGLFSLVGYSIRRNHNKKK